MFTLVSPLLLAITTLLLWLPQNAAHEGAHCLAHKHKAGDEITMFWPFPSFRLGGFSFACMKYHRPAGHVVTPFVEGLCAAAPQLANTIILLGLVPLHFLAVPAWLLSILVAWGLVNFVDGAANLGTFYLPGPRSGTDGYRFADAWGIPIPVCRVGTVVWHLGLGLHVAAFLR